MSVFFVPLSPPRSVKWGDNQTKRMLTARRLGGVKVRCVGVAVQRWSSVVSVHLVRGACGCMLREGSGAERRGAERSEAGEAEQAERSGAKRSGEPLDRRNFYLPNDAR